MDYSALVSDTGGFGDLSEPNPFAQPHTPIHTHPHSASPTLINDDSTEPLQSPFMDSFTPTPGFASPVLQQHDDDQGGFRSPGFVGEGIVASPRIPAIHEHHEHPEEGHHQGYGQRPEGRSQESLGGRQEQQQQQQQQQQEHQQEQQHQQQQHLEQVQGGRHPAHKLQAKITALERTGRKDPILRFDVHTNLPKFRTTQFRDVRRTHPEFQKLANHLLSSNPDCIVPAVPPPSTSAGVGTDEDEARVRATMQRWLNTVCSNDVLIRDEEIVFFVESDFGYSPVVRRKQPATGVRRRVIKQFAPPADDTPELEEARPVVKAFYLGAMETGQKVDRVVKSRRGVGLAESELGIRLFSLSQTESHPGMSNAFRKLGKTIQSVGDYHAAQATAEATTLGDPLNYHSSDAFIVKETLTNRQILMRELEAARKDTRSKFQTVEVLKGKGALKRDKVDEALSALEEAKGAEMALEGRVARVTGNLVEERRKWFARTARDMRASIRDYCFRQIEAERRTLATLESVRPEIRAIDASGGLSRLGRDAPPASRRASLRVSQGPTGDAWSGVQRVPGVNRPGAVEGALNGGGAGAASGIKEEEETGDEDRLDAKNAASRLAGSTF